jgi:hypothetical protein
LLYRAPGFHSGGVLYPGASGQIAAIPLGGGAPRRLVDVKGAALYFVTSLAGDPRTGTLFFTADNGEWRDLYVLNLETGKARPLQKDLRVGDLAWNPADASLWGVRHFNGISTLVQIKPPYTDWIRVLSLPFGQDLYDLAFSPDGAYLVGSASEINGRQSLRRMRPIQLLAHDTTAVTLHDFGASIPTGFVYSEDGRYLYGSSYYTGVSNIWRYEFASSSMEIVTNTETGLFRPLPLGGDSLIVFRYTGEGFVPAVIHDAHPLTDVSAITFLGAKIADDHPIVREWTIPPPSTIALDSILTRSGPYRTWDLRLNSIYPIVEGYRDYTAVGLATTISDPLHWNRIDLSASYSPAGGIPENERWHFSGAYKRPFWTVDAFWNAASFYDLVGPTKTSRKGYGGSVDFEKLVVWDRPREVTFRAGVSGLGGLDQLPSYQNVETPAGFDFLASGHVRLAYKNVSATIGAIDAERGIKWDVGIYQNMVRSGFSGDTWWKGYSLGPLDRTRGTTPPPALPHHRGGTKGAGDAA